MARAKESVHPVPPATTALFRSGFIAMLPLWAGAIPSGLAYGVAAHAAGLPLAEAQLMSLVVFSAAAQISAVGLLDTGASPLLLVGTAMALNAQVLLVSLTVGRWLRLSWPARLVSAWFLTDGAYGITAARGPLRAPVLLGAGISMFVAWNLGTLVGGVTINALPDPRRLGIDLVIPLTFLAVLVPLLRSRAAFSVALVAGVVSLALSRVLPVGVAVLGAGVCASAAGTWWTRADGSQVATPDGAVGLEETP